MAVLTLSSPVYCSLNSVSVIVDDNAFGPVSVSDTSLVELASYMSTGTFKVTITLISCIVSIKLPSPVTRIVRPRGLDGSAS